MVAIGDKFGKSSIDTDYAVATTVKTTRTAGVTVLEAFDLSKYAASTPVFFVTYKKTTDPLTGTVSVTNLVSWKALVNVGANTLTNLTLAPGYVDSGNAIGDFIECIPTSFWENSLIDGIFVGHNPDGTFKLSALKAALGNDGNLVDSLNDITSDFVVSGGIWSALAGLNAGMTALTGYIDGYKNTLAAVATRAFTLSKDTYIDVLRNVTTNVFTLVYTEVANGAAAPALAANSMRIAKVITSASVVTGISQPALDSLGNTIYPTNAIIGLQEAWKIPVLTNSWVNFGSGFADVAYMKDSMGFVHLRGMPKSGTLGGSIFNLPPGYRPGGNLYMASVANGPTTPGIINVQTNGNVVPDQGNNGYMSLSSIIFRAEQ